MTRKKEQITKEKQVAIRLDASLWQALKAEGKTMGHTLSGYIRYLLMTRHDRQKK